MLSVCLGAQLAILQLLQPALPTCCRAERGRQDEGGAEPQQWTRFKFSDAAELEEHRLQPAAVYGVCRWVGPCAHALVPRFGARCGGQGAVLHCMFVLALLCCKLGTVRAERDGACAVLCCECRRTQ